MSVARRLGGGRSAPPGVLAGAFSGQGAEGNGEAAVALYAVIALLMSAAWIPLFRHLHRHPELLVDAGDQRHFGAQRSRPVVGVISYALAGVLGYFVSPALALILFVWMIVYHAVTSEGLHGNRLARALAPRASRR